MNVTSCDSIMKWFRSIYKKKTQYLSVKALDATLEHSTNTWDSHVIVNTGLDSNKFMRVLSITTGGLDDALVVKTPPFETRLSEFYVELSPISDSRCIPLPTRLTYQPMMDVLITTNWTFELREKKNEWTWKKEE